MVQSRHAPPPRQKESKKHPFVIIKVIKGTRLICWGPPMLQIPCYSIALSSEEDDFTNTVVLREFTGDLAQERAAAWKDIHSKEFMDTPIKELWERFKPKKKKERRESWWKKWQISGCRAPENPPPPEIPDDD